MINIPAAHIHPSGSDEQENHTKKIREWQFFPWQASLTANSYSDAPFLFDGTV